MKPTTKHKLIKAIGIAVQALEIKCGGVGGTPGPCPVGGGGAKPAASKPPKKREQGMGTMLSKLGQTIQNYKQAEKDIATIKKTENISAGMENPAVKEYLKTKMKKAESSIHPKMGHDAISVAAFTKSVIPFAKLTGKTGTSTNLYKLPDGRVGYHNEKTDKMMTTSAAVDHKRVTSEIKNLI